MATCKNCIHEKVCVIIAFPEAFENAKWEKEPCDHFKDKTDYAEVKQIEGLQDEVVIKTDMLNNQKAEIEKLTVNMNAFGLMAKNLKEENDALKAEIERLHDELEFKCDDCKNIRLSHEEYRKAISQAKSEAYREYEGRVRMILEKRYGKAYMRESKTIADLVNLTKELTEKNDFKE